MTVRRESFRVLQIQVREHLTDDPGAADAHPPPLVSARLARMYLAADPAGPLYRRQHTTPPDLTAGAGGQMQFEIIDRCPVPARLAPALRRIKARSGTVLNSCDRSPEAEPHLRRYGKLSQRQLYEGWVQRRPGFNPANPPGYSTHERRNDGVAYPGPRGARLPYWCVGIDCTNTAAFIQAAKAEGYLAIVTYPNNPLEGHHVNFRREPRVRLAPRPLKRGSTGPRVLKLTRRLSRVTSPTDRKPYLDGARRRFDAETEQALRRFQREHHQADDGIYGPLSHKQLLASVRWRKRHGS